MERIIKKIFKGIKNPRLFIVRFFGLNPSLLSDDKYLKLAYKTYMGKDLNLKNPLSFTEKIQWLKLYNRDPLYTKLVDKYAVKDFVAKKIGDEHIIPTIKHWDNAHDINFDELPDKFVLKTTHDSGNVIVCTDKSKLNKKSIIKKLNKKLKTNYYGFTREWPYKDVPPRIIAETYVVDESGYELKDYKFFCFNGEPKILYVASGRQNGTKFNFFDIKFNPLPIKNGYEIGTQKIEKPQNFDQMLEIASTLSQGIPHVRVDLYNINGKIYFGEYTFSHFGGLCPFEPEIWDYKLGEWLVLPTDK